MNVKELKQILNSVPDDYEICLLITDIMDGAEYFSANYDIHTIKDKNTKVMTICGFM